MSSRIYARPRPRTGKPDPGLQRLARLFKALADPTRLRILALLGTGEVCVCHIYESLGIPQPKASRHLAYLRRAGLVDGRKIGLWVYYRLAEPIDDLARPFIASLAGELQRTGCVQADCCRLTDAQTKGRARREPARHAT